MMNLILSIFCDEKNLLEPILERLYFLVFYVLLKDNWSDGRK